MDANRDPNHDIKFASEDHSDATDADHPFRFWVNNDHDQGHAVDGTDWEEDDMASGDPDDKDKIITCRRDLEDFQRIWIKCDQDLVKDDEVVFEWVDVTDGTPGINLYLAAESDGGTRYLTDETVRQIHSGPHNGNAIDDYRSVAVGSVTSGSPGGQYVMKLRSAWPKNTTRYFLFEGCTTGKGTLKVSLRRNNQPVPQDVQSTAYKVFMDLKDIKEMYERWTVGDGNVEPSQTASCSGFNYPVPAMDEEKDYVLFVHGWNVFGWEKERYAETMYKRLYWQNYKGRVGVFCWPCLTDAGIGLPINDENGALGLTFDPSEFKAWKSGTGLLNCLTQLNSLGYTGRVRVLAHSQGNVVMTEALRQAKEGNLGQVCHTYVATQAAIPAHCYDASPSLPVMSASSVPPYPTTPNVYADYWGAGGHLPYAEPGHMSGTAGHFVNFFNPDDYALNATHWQMDQKTKPDNDYNYTDTLGFHYDPWNPWNARGLGFPQDRFEIFSFCAESRSFALGAQTGVGGVFETVNETDLEIAAYGFNRQHKFHSGQFRSNIARRWAYWDRFLVETGLKATP